MKIPLLAVLLISVLLGDCTEPTAPTTSQPSTQAATVPPDSSVRGHDQTVVLSYGSRKGKPFLSAADKLTTPEPPKDVREVEVIVESIELPLVNSPSIIGERASVHFTVKRGDVPAYPECIGIRLTFDSYVNPFSVGKHFTFQFLPNGDFWGIRELPFI
ncbi:MAG: hypothetical protein ABSB42_22305 [Tepidisphaeraceae bacterium]|jgi:hypothetical protein